MFTTQNCVPREQASRKNRLRLLLTTTALTCAGAFQALAAEGSAPFDVTTELTTSFQSMASTMLATISASLPVVMSVMSAYLCINFGIKFFKRFAK